MLSKAASEQAERVSGSDQEQGGIELISNCPDPGTNGMNATSVFTAV